MYSRCSYPHQNGVPPPGGPGRQQQPGPEITPFLLFPVAPGPMLLWAAAAAAAFGAVEAAAAAKTTAAAPPSLRFSKPVLVGESRPESVTGAAHSHFWFPEAGAVFGKPGLQAVIAGVRAPQDSPPTACHAPPSPRCPSLVPPVTP